MMKQLEGLLEGQDGTVSAPELRSMSLGLAHSLSRYKLKFSPDKVDTMVVQAIGLLDDLDKEWTAQDHKRDGLHHGATKPGVLFVDVRAGADPERVGSRMTSDLRLGGVHAKVSRSGKQRLIVALRNQNDAETAATYFETVPESIEAYTLHGESVRVPYHDEL